MKTKNILPAMMATLLAASALVFAQEAETTSTPTPAPAASRPDVRDYMPYPPPAGDYVSDNARLLTSEQIATLNLYCRAAERKTKVQVEIVTINSMKDYPGTANGSIEDFARGLFDAYGIGNMPKNDGILLLVARQDRKVRIEFGKHYGHARDADAQRIIDQDILPSFRRNEYADGIMLGACTILTDFTGMRAGEDANSTRSIVTGYVDRFTSAPWGLIGLAVTIFVLIPVCISLFRSGKRGWGWVVAGIIIFLIVLAFKIALAILANSSNSSSSGGGGGGGGFGGGSSGGGGASGSW